MPASFSQSGKLGSASNLSKEGSASGFRGLSSASMGAGSGSAAPVEEEGPRGYSRSGFVVVPLDGNFRGEAVRLLPGRICRSLAVVIAAAAASLTSAPRLPPA